MNRNEEEKRELRRRMLAMRRALSAEAVGRSDERGLALARLLLERFAPKTVGSYWPADNEFSSSALNEFLRSSGVEIALPVVKEGELFFYAFPGRHVLRPDRFGILCPPPDPERLIEPERFDAVIVPGVAFDRRLNRLGRGKGYYDRFLKKLPPNSLTIGLAYEFQILPEIPVSPDDVPVRHLWSETWSTLEEPLQ